MIRIGVLSDTHGFLYPEISEFFSNCNEVWHAGDIGSVEVANQLQNQYFLRAVTGNIDSNELRNRFPEKQVFMCEGIKVIITHIAGYSGRFNKTAKDLIVKEKPSLFIAGHSHILKVIFDKEYNFLYINPGAAGKYGFHQYSTVVRFQVNMNRIENLEVFNIEKLRNI